MYRLNKITQLFYSPDDAPGAIEDSKMSVSDMAEFMGKDDEATLDVPDDDDDDEAEEAGTSEKEAKDTKEETVEDELEEELKEADTEEVTLTVPRKAVLAKYPNIFKEFPHLDKAVYREQKYSELLPTLADAKAAVDKAETLDQISEQLSSGNTKDLLQEIKENDPAVFNTVVDNYLDNLRDVDQQAYFHVLGNTIKHLIKSMYDSGDDDNKIAAGLINKYIFNSDKYTPPARLSGDKTTADPRAEELAKKEQEFFNKQLDTHTTSVNTRIHNIVTSAIDKNIDPRGSMNEFTKNTAIEKCAKDLQAAVSKDARFQGLLDKLWQKSAESNFSQDSLDRIRSAYWSKAKGLLPDIIRKTRNTALKGLGTKSPNERSQPLPVGKPSNSAKNQNNSERRTSGSTDKDRARQIPKGTKSIDFLMRD